MIYLKNNTESQEIWIPLNEASTGRRPVPSDCGEVVRELEQEVREKDNAIRNLNHTVSELREEVKTAIEDGKAIQAEIDANKLEDGTFTENGIYTPEYGYKSVTVAVSGGSPECEEAIEELENVIAEKDERIEVLDNTVTTLNGEIELRDNEIARLNQEVEDVRAESYASGRTEQEEYDLSRLEEISVNMNGVYEPEYGYKKVNVNVPTGEINYGGGYFYDDTKIILTSGNTMLHSGQCVEVSFTIKEPLDRSIFNLCSIGNNQIGIAVQINTSNPNSLTFITYYKNYSFNQNVTSLVFPLQVKVVFNDYWLGKDATSSLLLENGNGECSVYSHTYTVKSGFSVDGTDKIYLGADWNADSVPVPSPMNNSVINYIKIWDKDETGKMYKLRHYIAYLKASSQFSDIVEDNPSSLANKLQWFNRRSIRWEDSTQWPEFTLE